MNDHLRPFGFDQRPDLQAGFPATGELAIQVGVAAQLHLMGKFQAVRQPWQPF